MKLPLLVAALFASAAVAEVPTEVPAPYPTFNARGSFCLSTDNLLDYYEQFMAEGGTREVEGCGNVRFPETEFLTTALYWEEYPFFWVLFAEFHDQSSGLKIYGAVQVRYKTPDEQSQIEI